MCYEKMLSVHLFKCVYNMVLTENANPNDPESLHHSDPTTPTSPDGSLQDWLNNASLSPSQPLWNSDTISR